METAWKMFWVALLAILKTVRFMLFIVLMFFSPIVTLVLSLASGAGLLGFLFCLIFFRDQHTPLWAFLTAGLVSTLALWVYDALLMALAPDGYIVIIEQ